MRITNYRDELITLDPKSAVGILTATIDTQSWWQPKPVPRQIFTQTTLKNPGRFWFFVDTGVQVDADILIYRSASKAKQILAESAGKK